MQSARIFKGKKPESLEHALVIAKQEPHIVYMRMGIYQEKDALIGTNRLSHDIGSGKNQAWIFIEADCYRVIGSVGVHGSGADCIVSGPFFEYSPTVISSINIKVV